ncbi:MAG TPA: hypothetical protein VFX37_10495 [Pseudolabrys sp.]|nr:hypothetical protein [Pseudolabrys sp.]
MSFGAPFPAAKSALEVTFLGHTTGNISGGPFNFGPPDARRILIACFGFQTGGSPTISACSIGGVAATNLVNSGLSPGSRAAAICAALVPTGLSGNVVASGPTITSGRAAIYLYSLLNTTGIHTDVASSTANNPSATKNIGANNVAIGVAAAGGASSPSPSWSGLIEDAADSFSLQTFTSASEFFANAAAAHAMTCAMAGTAGSAGAFAVFSR